MGEKEHKKRKRKPNDVQTSSPPSPPPQMTEKEHQKRKRQTNDVQTPSLPQQPVEGEVKKRKRQSNGVQTPNKKVAFENPLHQLSGKYTVTHVPSSTPLPVVVSVPTPNIPDVSFTAYVKPKSTTNTQGIGPHTHDINLQSSDHPRLNYFASPNSSDQQTSHYLLVIDESTRQCQWIPTYYVHLHSKLRTEEEETDANEAPKTMLQQREALGREFGTRKALKMIKSRTENAITTDFKGKGKASDNQTTILDNAADSTAGVAAKDEAADLLALLASKPIPKPNVDAESPEDVYSYDTLLPASEARMIQVKDWQEKFQTGEKIEDLKHRYPAYWIDNSGQTDNMPKLKALRYLELLLEFHESLSKSGRQGMKVPKKEVLSKRLGHWPSQLVDAVRRRFADQSGSELPKWNMDNLYTHICAIVLYLDGYSKGTDISNLREDLRMETKQLGQYFLELGCTVVKPNITDQRVLGLSKSKAAITRIAKLKVPLTFPKPSKRRR